MTTTPAPRRRTPPSGARLLLTCVAIVIALAVVSLAVLLPRDLPAQVAIQWGPEGVTNEMGSGAARWVPAGVGLAAAVVLLVMAAAMHRSTRHVLAGTAVFLGAFITVGITATTALQSGMSPADRADLGIAPAVIGAAVVGLALGGGVAWWGRPSRPVHDGPPGPLPKDAEVLDVPAGARVAWTGTARPGTGSTVLLLLVLLGTAALLWLSVAPWAVLLVLLPGALVLALLLARVSIGARGLRVAALGGLVPWVRARPEDLRSAAVTTVRVGDFGGIGMRLAADGRRGFITRSGEALEVRRRSQPSIVVTVDDAARAAATLNTLLADRPRD